MKSSKYWDNLGPHYHLRYSPEFDHIILSHTVGLDETLQELGFKWIGVL